MFLDFYSYLHISQCTCHADTCMYNMCIQHPNQSCRLLLAPSKKIRQEGKSLLRKRTTEQEPQEEREHQPVKLQIECPWPSVRSKCLQPSHPPPATNVWKRWKPLHLRRHQYFPPHPLPSPSPQLRSLIQRRKVWKVSLSAEKQPPSPTRRAPSLSP